MATSPITPERIGKMVEHWLSCPPRGYLRSNYGSDVKSLLQEPLAAGRADELVRKCHEDIPLIAGMPGGGLEVYAYEQGIDQQVVVFEVAGRRISVGEA